MSLNDLARFSPDRRRALMRATLAATPWLGLGTAAAAQPRGDGYPRLLGMNIGAKNYHEPAYQEALSRLDIAILGLYPGWRSDRGGLRFRELLADLKRRNPRLLVGQYTILNESSDDPRGASRDRVEKLDREDWWLRRSDGSKTSWTNAYNAVDINITDWSKPDRNGERYPQWLARRDFELFFDAAGFDIWYFDNVMIRSRVKQANWRLDGRDLSGRDPDVEAAFRRGMAAHWAMADKLAPRVLKIGNVDNDLSSPEYRGRLDGAFLEGLMGKSWSLETREGWPGMMRRYLDVRANLRGPAIVGFNVSGRADDFAFFRYAFCSSLLGDGYFSFTDSAAGYSSVPWFDEYDVRLGKPVDPVATQAWSNGIFRRRYERAMALVNPDPAPKTVSPEPGWRRFKGVQDPATNNGEAASGITLPPRAGILLTKGT